MKIIILLVIIYILAFLYRIGLNRIHSNFGHNVAKRHLKDEFDIDTDKRED